MLVRTLEQGLPSKAPGPARADSMAVRTVPTHDSLSAKVASFMRTRPVPSRYRQPSRNRGGYRARGCVLLLLDLAGR